MNKKLLAVISAFVVLAIVVGVGTGIYFKNKKEVDDSSYSSVELSPEEVLFSQSSNKPHIKLILDEKTFTEAFGEKPDSFTYKKADRIRIHFSDSKKFELEPTEETVKVEKSDDNISIKLYIDDKDIFEKVNKLIRFDTACSVKIFFDEGTFKVDGNASKAVTFILRFESKLVSDVEQAYMRATYDNYVLKLSLTDLYGNELCFSTAGNTNESIIAYVDKTNQHSFNNDIVIAESFRTAILNPSESFSDGKTIYIYVPDGFFVNAEGNRIKVLGLKNSGSNIRLIKSAGIIPTSTPQSGATEPTAVNLTSADGVTATASFGEEIPIIGGKMFRNLTDVEVMIPTTEDWGEVAFTGRILTATETYEIPSIAISSMRAEITNGYAVFVSVKDAHTCMLSGVELDGISYEDNQTYDMELVATDKNGNTVANISVPLDF